MVPTSLTLANIDPWKQTPQTILDFDDHGTGMVCTNILESYSIECIDRNSGADDDFAAERRALLVGIITALLQGQTCISSRAQELQST